MTYLLYYTIEDKENKGVYMKQICLLTGANSETGIYIAKKLSRQYKMILVWHNDNTRILANKKYLRDAEILQGDMSKEEGVETIFSNIYVKYSKIDLIVNCIGKNVKIIDEEIDECCWDDVLSNNLKPILFIGRYYHKYHQDGQTGCWINFSSTAGIRGIPVAPHYIVSKAGVIAMSEYYAKILAPNIRVNTIAPGFIETSQHNKSSYDSIRSSTPLKRMATFGEIVDTVMYLVKCEFVTGQTIVVDGGLIL